MKIKKKKYGKTEKGFTLIELLVVMIIIGLLGSLVGPKMFGSLGKSKTRTAKAQISLFETALDMYRLDIGKYPTTDMGLAALRTKPEANEKWDGPYLPKEIPMDPWDNPYNYKSPSEHGDYEIISYGADGVEGGKGDNQDIVNWREILKG